VIGSASNLLISDDGVAGLVVKAAESGVREAAPGSGPDVLLTAAAGAMLAAVGKQAALRGLAGLEWAINVPGTVGASVVNNSGAFGSCVADHLVAATIHIPRSGAVSFDAAALEYGYRTSRMKRGDLDGVILEATYLLRRADASTLRARIAEIQRIRRTTQPSAYSVGSVFANPPDDAAGRLIEAAGCKGARIGDAEVSTLHANFIVNRGGARARDVLALIAKIRDAVWRSSRVWLIPEVQLAGRFAPDDIPGSVPAENAP
jgi:UDP-N-acetylmuramate dehydrogenase